jgi:LEA14-like dessication related protein
MQNTFSSINPLKVIQKLLLFVVLITPTLLLSGCDFEEINFKGIEKFELLDQKDDQIKLKLMMRVENLNKFNIILKNSDLDLSLNDTYIGKATIDAPVKLKKKSEAAYPVVLNIKGKDVLKKTMGMMGTILSGPIKFSAKGKVTGKAYGISKAMDVAFTEKLNLADFVK